MERLFLTVLQMSKTASIVICVVLLARFVLRNAPKVFSYLLWTVVLFRLLCPVGIPVEVSIPHLEELASKSPKITVNQEANSGEIMAPPAEVSLPNEGEFSSAQTDKPTDLAQPIVESRKDPKSAIAILSDIWLVGAVGVFLYGLISYVRFKRHLVSACLLEKHIYVADHIDSAFVVGFVSPKIYLPSDVPADKMEYIIAHERVHIQRFDHVTRYLAFVALCIHWFNPLVWLAFILSGSDMEMSCDEAVLRKLGTQIRADYSASLLSLAMDRPIVSGSPLAFGEGNTRRRIMNIAKWKPSHMRIVALCGCLCLVVMGFCACEVMPKQNNSAEVEPSETAVVSAPMGLDELAKVYADDTGLSVEDAISLFGGVGSDDAAKTYRVFRQRMEGTSVYKPTICFYVETNEDQGDCTIVRVITADIDGTDQNTTKQYNGNVYYHLESPTKLYYTLDGDFYDSGTVTREVMRSGLEEGTSINFVLSNSSGHYKGYYTADYLNWGNG